MKPCDVYLGGVSLRQLLSLKATAGPEAPIWLPDGSGIVVKSASTGGASIRRIIPKSGKAEVLVDELGKLPFLASALLSVSPDGKWISYVGDMGVDDGREQSSRVEIWLVPLDGGPKRQLTRIGANINAYKWAQDGSAIVLSANLYGRYDIYTVAVPSGETVRLTDDELYEVYPTFTPDGSEIVYVRLNEDWTDHELVRMANDGSNARTITVDEDLFDYHYGRRFGYPIVSAPKNIVIYPSHRSGWINYWLTPLDGGPATQLSPDSSDQTEAVLSPDGNTLAYVSNSNGTLRLEVVSLDGGAARVLVSPDQGVVSAPAWSPDGKHISYLLETPTCPADLWLVDVETGVTRRVTWSGAAMELATKLQASQKITYTSFDGLEISAYLYSPPNREPGVRYPGLIIAHGGPTMQFFDNYQPDVQYFIRRGYVVLQPNIRGSSGYGKMFEDANNQDWGHGDLRDVLAGVEYLRTLDYVDGENMGIHGTSYGGCMSMSAVAFAPGVFKASVPHAGYGDWLGFEEGQELRHRQLMKYEFGDVDENREVYIRCSPIYKLRDATTPVFLVHGEGMPPRSDASLKFARALEMDYKTYEYKIYPNNSYYVFSVEGQLEMLPDIADFLDRYLR